jgi:hypothetical protein
MSAEIIKLPRPPSKSRQRQAAPEPGSLDALCSALPFLKRNHPRKRGGGYTYWSVIPTGNYLADYEEGMRLAKLFLPVLRYVGGPVMLGSIVIDMIKTGIKDEENGLVLGFMRVIGQSCSLGMAVDAMLGRDPPPGAV